MTQEEILDIQINNDKTIGEWLLFISLHGMYGANYRISTDGFITIKARLNHTEVYSEIYHGHFSDFEILINSMWFFKKMFTQR